MTDKTLARADLSEKEQKFIDHTHRNARVSSLLMYGVAAFLFLLASVQIGQFIQTGRERALPSALLCIVVGFAAIMRHYQDKRVSRILNKLKERIVELEHTQENR